MEYPQLPMEQAHHSQHSERRLRGLSASKRKQELKQAVPAVHRKPAMTLVSLVETIDSEAAASELGQFS